MKVKSDQSFQFDIVKVLISCFDSDFNEYGKCSYFDDDDNGWNDGNGFSE